METFSALLALVWGIHQLPVNSRTKGQECGVLMFSLICAWINSRVNNCEAGDLRRHRSYDLHYFVNILKGVIWPSLSPCMVISPLLFLIWSYSRCCPEATENTLYFFLLNSFIRIIWNWIERHLFLLPIAMKMRGVGCIPVSTCPSISLSMTPSPNELLAIALPHFT